MWGEGLGASQRRGPGRSQGRVHSPPCFPTSHCSQRDHPHPRHSPHPRPPEALTGAQVPRRAQLQRPSCPGNHGTNGNPAPGTAPRDFQVSEEQGQSPGQAQGTLCSPRQWPAAPPDTLQGQIPPGMQAPDQGPPHPTVSGSPGSLMGKLRPRGRRSQIRASAETEGSVSSFHHRGR